ncbi:Kanadaptin [Entophlyctis sp. JEL0112]|nr:Kanadaptin [Entophlyctis sp. JEL0112]
MSGKFEFAVPAAPASASRQQGAPAAVHSNRAHSDANAADVPPPPPSLNYDIPSWSGLSPAVQTCMLEVIKNGAIVDTVHIEKPVMLFGRLPTCEVSLDHASVSRQHAILQSSAFPEQPALSLFDLNSAHGTFLNKTRIQPRTHTPLRDGDIFRFGMSSRVFVVCGLVSADGDDPGDRISTSSTEATKALPAQMSNSSSNDDFEVTWGFGEDAVNYSDESLYDVDDSAGPVDPDAYYYRDSKKALKTWCDARNHDITFTFEEEGFGNNKVYVATLRLDIDGGREIVATGRAARKKEAERQAALDACIKLDRRKILRSTSSGASKSEAVSKRKKFDDDDDNDSFYDRIEGVFKVRQKKPKKSEVEATAPETFESLSEKLKEKTDLLNTVNSEIEAIDASINAKEANPDVDEIDQYVSDLETASKFKLKKTLVEKRNIITQVLITFLLLLIYAFDTQELKRIEHLVQLAKPHEINFPVKAQASLPVATFDSSRESGEGNVDGELSSPAKDDFLEVTDAPPTVHSASKPNPTEDEVRTANTPTVPIPTPAPVRRGPRRAFVVLTQSQMQQHADFEKDDMIDAVHGDGESILEEISKYGY